MMRSPFAAAFLCLFGCSDPFAAGDEGFAPRNDAGPNAALPDGGRVVDAGRLPFDGGLGDEDDDDSNDSGIPMQPAPTDAGPGGGEGRRADGGDDGVTAPELPPCPNFSAGNTSGYVVDIRVVETSGVVEGRRNPGILWVHNDSGADAEIFALSTSGEARGKFILEGAGSNDWEDIAIGPGPDAALHYLYIGDIGDNNVDRARIVVYRVPEPVAGNAFTVQTLSEVERFRLEYHDGPHNAETLLVDPLNGDVYIVTKVSNGNTPVYRARAPLDADSPNALEWVTTLAFTGDSSDERLATAGDISTAGDEIVIRTYQNAFLWRRPIGGTIADALDTPACNIPLVEEGQGEAIGFAADGTGYFTLGEGQLVGIHAYERE